MNWGTFQSKHLGLTSTVWWWHLTTWFSPWNLIQLKSLFHLPWLWPHC